MNRVKKYNVAVYGTLMMGQRNHRWAEQAGCVLIAEGTVAGHLLDTGWSYPMIDLRRTDGRVAVEVYEVTMDGIRHMDILEGYPRLYDRKEVVVETDDGTLNALIYTPGNQKMMDGMARVEPGEDGIADWRRDR